MGWGGVGLAAKGFVIGFDFLCFAKRKKAKKRLAKLRHREERSDAAIHKCSNGNAWFLRRVSAWWPSYFLLLRQKKVTKEKASQRPRPYGLPCATRGARGRAQTRFAQTSARPDPRATALLSTANGGGDSACSFAALTLHTLQPAGRATRTGAKAPASACALARRTAAISAPSTKPQPINYNRIIPQSRRTNPPRNLPHQHPYPAKKTKLGIQAPLHPGGGEGAGGGSGGRQSGVIKSPILKSSKKMDPYRISQSTKPSACFRCESCRPCDRACATLPAMQRPHLCHCFGCAWRGPRHL